MPRIVVDVMLKPEILDPQGRAVRGALSRLGLAGVSSVRQGKRFEIELEGELDDDLQAQLEELAGSLLSNPVIEDWNLYLAEAERRTEASSDQGQPPEASLMPTAEDQSVPEDSAVWQPAPAPDLQSVTEDAPAPGTAAVAQLEAGGEVAAIAGVAPERDVAAVGDAGLVAQPQTATHPAPAAGSGQAANGEGLQWRAAAEDDR